MEGINYAINQSQFNDVLLHLKLADADFIPPLHETVSLDEYAQKIIDRAIRIEAWDQQNLVGLIAIYLNNIETKMGFITNVSVLKTHANKGIARKMMERCMSHSKNQGFEKIALEVNEHNHQAIKLYHKNGFVEVSQHASTLKMEVIL